MLVTPVGWEFAGGIEEDAPLVGGHSEGHVGLRGRDFHPKTSPELALSIYKKGKLPFIAYLRKMSY